MIGESFRWRASDQRRGLWRFQKFRSNLSAEFTLNGTQFGGGVLVLNQGHIHSADGIYAYKGLYLMA